MRQRIKNQHVCHIENGILTKIHHESIKYPYVKVFDKWIRIQESEVKQYKGFQIVYQ